ncbi:MAG TPA: accessory factor UbiK family protein [Steroidobacteraceae bacterium]|nr:accessory factor UbiK family protein [Steroidobacteraceae bacterium]
MDIDVIEQLARKLAAALPDSISAMRNDVEQNFKAVLQSTLSRMDIVSRQEFDVQVGVLNRVRTQLSQLEQRLAAMEQSSTS